MSEMIEETTPITLLDLTLEQETSLCKETHTTWERLKNARSPRDREWKDLERILGAVPNKKKEGNLDPAIQVVGSPKSMEYMTVGENNIENTKVELATYKTIEDSLQSYAIASIETLHTSLMSSMFPTGQTFINVDPFDGVEPTQAENVQKFLRDFLNLIDFKNMMSPVIKDILKYGTCILCYEWVNSEATIWKDTKEPDDLGKKIYKKLKKTKYNATKLTPINIHNIWYDTTHTDPSEAMIIRKKYMSGSEIINNPNYVNRHLYEEIQKASVNITPEEYSSYENREGMNLFTIFSASPKSNQQVEVFEAWGDFTVGGLIYKNYVLEYAINATKKEDVVDPKQSVYSILRFEPNPYESATNPYIIAKIDNDPKSFYPKSPVELALNHYRTIAEMQQSIKDLSASASNRPFIMNDRAFTAETLKKLKDGIIHKDMVLHVDSTEFSINNVFSRIQDNLTMQMQPIMNFIEFLKMQAQSITGETQSMSGGQAPQYMKTGVAMAFQEGALNRLSVISSAIESNVSLVVFRKTLEYMDQFLQVGSDIVTNKGRRKYTQKVPFTELEAKLTITGASFTSTRQLETNNLMQTLQMFMGSPIAPLLGDGPMLRLIKQLLAKLGISDIDDIIDESLIRDRTQKRLTIFDKILNRSWGKVPSAQEQQSLTQPPGGSGGQPNAPLTDANLQATLG